ncbi:MAG: hypothetical protein ACOYBL_11790 [Lachnospiraceae bacterium]|jgi:hypothetical protein
MNQNKTRELEKNYANVAVEAIRAGQTSDEQTFRESREYLQAMSEIYNSERDMLQKELESDISEERRKEIFERLAEISQLVVEDSRKHDEDFLKPIHEESKNNNLRILASVFMLAASAAGLVIKYKKPIMEAGKQLVGVHK